MTDQHELEGKLSGAEYDDLLNHRTFDDARDSVREYFEFDPLFSDYESVTDINADILSEAYNANVWIIEDGFIEFEEVLLDGDMGSDFNVSGDTFSDLMNDTVGSETFNDGFSLNYDSFHYQMFTDFVEMAIVEAGF